MPDRFGPRGTFALFIPQQNANMQPEYEMLRPEGINNQIYRFTLAQHDRAPEAMLDVVDQALGCWPDLVLVGNSVEMRLWTWEEHKEYKQKLSDKIGGLPLITAADGCIAGLKTIGAGRIACLSPMSDEYSQSAADFYRSLGFDIAYHAGLQVDKPENIIKVTLEQAKEGFRQIDHDDVDVFLHVGGALGIVDMIEELEAEFGRPFVTVNAATYWYALRTYGIKDPLPGFGQLLMHEDVAE